MCRRIPCIGIEINKKRRNLIVAVLRLKALALPIYAEWQRAEPTLMYIINTPEFPRGNMVHELHTRRRLPLLRS